MGLGGISIWQLLIILAIVIMIFGTKRLKNIGSDLGGAIKGFRESLAAEDNNSELEHKNEPDSQAGSSETTSSKQANDQ